MGAKPPSSSSHIRNQSGAPKAGDHSTDFPSIFKERGSNIFYEGEPSHCTFNERSGRRVRPTAPTRCVPVSLKTTPQRIQRSRSGVAPAGRPASQAGTLARLLTCWSGLPAPLPAGAPRIPAPCRGHAWHQLRSRSSRSTPSHSLGPAVRSSLPRLPPAPRCRATG